MHIVIATSGTHGDVRPFVALAHGVLAHGHTVTIAGSTDFENFVQANGVAYQCLQGSISDLLNMEGVSISSPFALLRSLPKLYKTGMALYQDGLQNIWDICRGEDGGVKPDIIIAHPKCTYAEDSAEALGIPCVMAAFQPLDATQEFPMIAFGGGDFGGWLNRLSYKLVALQARVQLKRRNEIRVGQMGLPKKSARKIWQDYKSRTTLYAFSKYVQEVPQDWPDNKIISGFWPLSPHSDWRVEGALQDFLTGGAPVYIGFGSMPISAHKTIAGIVSGLKDWGGRAIIGVGHGKGAKIWRDLVGDDPNLFCLTSAPHDKLFAHVSGVVTHGGAGSTHAGLLAGRPTWTVPHAMDQFFWGRKVFEAGCGPRPIKFSKVTQTDIATHIADLVSNPLYAQQAQSMAVKMNAENGIENTVQWIEHYVARYKPT